MSDRVDSRDTAAQEALVAAILARTSGSVCASARARLCERVDGELSPFDRALVDGHLAHCTDCAELAATLAHNSGLLPTLVATAPSGPFVAQVLAATSARPRLPTLSARLAGWWRRAIARPRFSFELAYVGTLLLALVLGNPVAALRQASSLGSELAAPRVAAIETSAHGIETRARATVAKVQELTARLLAVAPDRAPTTEPAAGGVR